MADAVADRSELESSAPSLNYFSWLPRKGDESSSWVSSPLLRGEDKSLALTSTGEEGEKGKARPAAPHLTSEIQHEKIETSMTKLFQKVSLVIDMELPKIFSYSFARCT